MHKHPKKPLYEVINKAWIKSHSDKKLEQLKLEANGQSGSGSSNRSDALGGEHGTFWPNRPRLVQFNAGRIEISLPYQFMIALFLVFVLLIVVAFTLGQKQQRAIDEVRKPPDLAQPTRNIKKPAVENKITKNVRKTAPNRTKGGNRIVITQYNRKKDLIPVQTHFASFGIDTVIENRQSRFFLVTSDAYENPQKAGTDGAAAKKKIIEVGAKYKAPAGFERFAPRLFSDAYGEKIK